MPAVLAVKDMLLIYSHKNIQVLSVVRLMAIIWIIFFSLFQTGCSNKKDNKKESVEFKNPVSIYLLSPPAREEWFTGIKDFSAATGASEMVPWPQAVRITDIAETENGAIVILVNKRGVIAGKVSAADSGISLQNSKASSINKDQPANAKKKSNNNDNNPSYSLISQITHESLDACTSGKIVKGGGSILCHVYIDSFFDNSLSLPSSPFVEIDIDNSKSIYSRHSYPDALSKLSLINLKKIDDKWFSAWKKSDNNGTFFKYFIHNSAIGENASEIAESRFMLANQFLNKSNLPDNIKEFIFNITKTEQDNNSVIELELRSKNISAVSTYLLGAAESNSSKYEKICAASEQGKYFISYKGEIYLIENSGIFKLSGAGKLPDNYNYTVLYAAEDTLYAAWEQQNFFLTGASGFSLIDIKRVDKIPQ